MFKSGMPSSMDTITRELVLLDIEGRQDRVLITRWIGRGWEKVHFPSTVSEEECVYSGGANHRREWITERVVGSERTMCATLYPGSSKEILAPIVRKRYGSDLRGAEAFARDSRPRTRWDVVAGESSVETHMRLLGMLA